MPPPTRAIPASCTSPTRAPTVGDEARPPLPMTFDPAQPASPPGGRARRRRRRRHREPRRPGDRPAVLVIQEDRNDAASGYNRVHVYDLTTGVLTPVARLDPPRQRSSARRPGRVGIERRGGRQRVLRPGMWLLNVQAHTRGSASRASTSGSTRPLDSAASFILIRIPGS